MTICFPQLLYGVSEKLLLQLSKSLQPSDTCVDKSAATDLTSVAWALCLLRTRLSTLFTFSKSCASDSRLLGSNPRQCWTQQTGFAMKLCSGVWRGDVRQLTAAHLGRCLIFQLSEKIFCILCFIIEIEIWWIMLGGTVVVEQSLSCITAIANDIFRGIMAVMWPVRMNIIITIASCLYSIPAKPHALCAAPPTWTEIAGALGGAHTFHVRPTT